MDVSVGKRWLEYSRQLLHHLGLGQVRGKQRQLLSILLLQVLTLIPLLLSALYWQAWSVAIGFSVLMASSVLMGIGVVRLKNSAGVSHSVIVLALATVVTIVVAHGGMTGGAILWLAIVPTTAIFLLGIKGGGIWLAITLLSVLSLFTLELTNNHFTSYVPEVLQLSQTLLLDIWCLVILFAVSLNYRSMINNTEKTLIYTVDQLCQEVDRSARAEQLAKAANEAKSLFLSNMSHELRTPLNVIIGFSRQLKRMSSTLTMPQKEAVQAIDRNGAQLLNLINDLLDLANIEEGKIQLQKVHLEVDHILKEALQALLPLANNHGLKVSTEIDANVSIEGDPRVLTQVFYNLLCHGIRYTNDGEIKVRLKTEDEQVRVVFSDSGRGFTTAELEQLLDTYNHLHSQLGNVVDASPLSVALSKKFIDMHQGEFAVTSERGQGSTFTVTLPLSQDQQVSNG